jgi:hypothetical protein
LFCDEPCANHFARKLFGLLWAKNYGIEYLVAQTNNEHTYRQRERRRGTHYQTYPFHDRQQGLELL